MEISLREYRCTNCNKLLLKASLKEGVVEIKCRNCKTMNLIKTPECNFCSNDPKQIFEKKLESA